MNKLLSWVKSHKILSALIILVLFIIGVSTGGGQKQATTTKSSATSKVATTVQAPNSPPYPYNTLLNTDTGAIANLNATIDPSENNKTDLPALCKYFSEVAASKPKEYYTANLYDDPTITQKMLDAVVSGSATNVQNSDYDLHYVLNYNYNPTTHNNVCNIQYGGDNDSNPSDNQSITY
jgi:hypothetical protein